MTPAWSAAPVRPGSLLVVGLLSLGLTAAGLAIWYQRAQTHRCLGFYGPTAAKRVSKASRVEVWRLAPTDRPARLVATERRDVSEARGIVHLRRGLVEDAGFRWEDAGPPGRLPAESWDYAFVFTDDDGGRTAVVVDLDASGGWLTVAGQGGRVGLGRLGRGLTTWISATVSGD